MSRHGGYHPWHARKHVFETVEDVRAYLDTQFAADSCVDCGEEFAYCCCSIES